MLEDYIIKLNKEKIIYLQVKASPGKPKTEIKEIMKNNIIKISISSPPEKGKANKELIKFLSKEFNVQKDNIKINSGESGKIKLIKISI
jgi:uncharacterized protein